MAYQLIDKFAGTAGASLFGHTPDAGTTPWSSSTTYIYAGSDLRLGGSGLVYSLASPSHVLWPGTVASSTFEARFSLLRATALTSSNAGIVCFGDATRTNYYVFRYREGAGFEVVRVAGGSGAIVASSSLTLTVGLVYEVRLRVTDGASRAFAWSYSSDAGQTWTALASYTDNAPLAPSVNVGLALDLAATSSTGMQVGNLRVGPNPTTPGLSVSPTAATVSTPLTVTFTGSGTAWKSGTTTPTFTVSGGTGPSLASESLTGVDAGTATLNPGTTAGTITLTDPTGGTATVTVTSGAPTAITLSGANTSTVGVASGTITATLNGVAPGGGTSIALTVATITGTFATTPLVIAAGQTTGTFTFTPTSAGSGTITAASAGLTSGTLAYTAAAQTLVVSPTTATAGYAASVSITPTLTGPGSLTASTTAGALSTTTPTSGVPFTLTAPSSTTTVTVTVSGPGGLTATTVVSVSPVVSYDSSISGAPTGYASTATVTPRAWNGSALSTPGGATAGTVAESTTPGTYICRLTYPTSALPASTIPVAHWLVNGVAAEDFTPVASVAASSAPTVAQIAAGLSGTPMSLTSGERTTLATAVWQDTTAGDFTVANSPGAIVYSMRNMATDGQVLAVTSPTTFTVSVPVGYSDATLSSGVMLEFTSGANALYRLVIASAIRVPTTTTVGLTFAAPGFPVAPTIGDTIKIF